MKEAFKRKVEELSTSSIVNNVLSYNKKYSRGKGETWKLRALLNELALRKDKTSYFSKVLETLQDDEINHNDILHFYIKEFLDIDIPRRSICKKHRAPFTFVADMFFEEVRNSIAFANRTGGKTTNIAILNHLDMTFKGGCEIASAGSTLDQAGRCYRYFRDFHNKNEYLQDLLLKEPTLKSSIYKNGSLLEIVTGTIAGLNSPHPQKARIDEIELMDWDVLQQGLSMTKSHTSPTTGKEIMSQNCFSCITNDTPIDVPRDMKKYPDGVPLKELKKRFDKGEQLFVYCFSHRANRFTLKKINNIWKTKREKVFTLKYKNKKKIYEIDITREHLILLRSNEYKELLELNPGDSLMSFNRKLKGNYHYIDLGEKGKQSSYVPEYYYIYGKINNDWPSKKEHIHHSDFNSYNNNPENFEKLSINKHMKVHMNTDRRKEELVEVGKRLGKYNKEFWKNGNRKEQKRLREIRSVSSKKLWKDNYDKMCAASKKGHTEEARIKRSNSLKGKLIGSKNPMFNISYDNHPKGMLGKFHTDKVKNILSNSARKQNILRGKKRVNELIVNFDLEDLYLNKLYSLSKISEITGFSDNIIKRSLDVLNIKIRSKSEQSKAQWNFIERDEYLSNRTRKAAQIRHGTYNHKVISVKEKGIRDVYDIEVEDHHNFVVNGGIVLHNSTRKYESGTMQRLLNMAAEDKRKVGGFKVYNWCVWEILEKCERKCFKDEKYGDCLIYEFCKGKARNCSGFYKIDDFIDKAVMLDKDTLEAEWLNMRPSRSIFVYGDYYDEKFHMIPRKEFDLNNEAIVVVGGIDFGASPGHPFVYKEYICDCTDFKREVESLEYFDQEIKSKIIFYLNYEYRSGSDTTEGHSVKIKGSPNYNNEMPIFADPSAKQERLNLEGIYGITTIEADNAVVAGIDRVRAHLQVRGQKSHYYIMEDYFDCDSKELKGSHEEFQEYKFRRGKDGKVNHKEPEKKDDHGMDVDRYVISSATVYLKEYFLPTFEDIEEDDWW